LLLHTRAELEKKHFRNEHLGGNLVGKQTALT
jgi:hypothetical protein